jgi:hypothetical protein
VGVVGREERRELAAERDLLGLIDGVEAVDIPREGNHGLAARVLEVHLTPSFPSFFFTSTRPSFTGSVGFTCSAMAAFFRASDIPLGSESARACGFVAAAEGVADAAVDGVEAASLPWLAGALLHAAVRAAKTTT